MKVKIIQKSFIAIIAFFFTSFFLTSCENFMNGGELKKEIEKAVIYANSNPTDLYFSSSCGKISPNGKIQFKITDTINLMFTEDPDYQFVQWTILDQYGNDLTNDGYINISEKYNLSTEAIYEKFPKDGVQLNIVPLCATHPKVISWTPSLNSDGAYRDARIAVSFDHALNEDSIYFTEKELDELRSKGITNFLTISSTENGKTYGYKQDGEIYYKNISIRDKETGENLLSKYGEPRFEGNDTFVLPTKIQNEAPIAGTQIIVEIRNFFYEYDDESIAEKNRLIKMGSSHKWHYFVNGNTDSISPSLPVGYFVKAMGTDFNGKEREINQTSITVNNQSDLKAIYLKDKKLHVTASIFDSGSGIAPNGYSNGKLITSGFWAEIEQIYNEHYQRITKAPQTIPIAIKTISSIATSNTYIDFAGLDDGIYHIDFYAKDKNGNQTKLKNGGYVLIDETAPTSISKLNPSYIANNSTSHYYVHWTNPEEPDYDYIEFTANSNDPTNPLSDTKNMKDSPYSVSLEYLKSSVEFTFSATPVDIFGNRGKPFVTNHIPKTHTIIKSIELSHKHFDGTIKNQSVTATVNFESLATNQLLLILKEKNSSSPVIITNPTIDTSSGTVSYNFLLSDLNSTTTAGKEYEIYVTDSNGNILKDANENNVIERLVVTSSPSVSLFKLGTNSIPLSSVKDGTTVKATITGTNLDLQQIFIRYYKLDREIDEKGNWISSNISYLKELPIDTSSLAWYSGKNNSTPQTISVDIPVPNTDNLYCFKLFYNSKELYTSKVEDLPQLYVYKNPSFSSFYIPKSVSSKAGNTIVATIEGKNLEAPEAEYTFSCPSEPEITSGCTYFINSDTKMSVTLKVPYNGNGNYEIFATSKLGGEKIKGELTIYKNVYSVGDLVLSNGEFLPYDKNRSEFTGEDFNGAIPIGVVCKLSEEGTPKLMIGIHNTYGDSTSMLSWAKVYTSGFNSCFYGIIGDTSNGDIDGSDNWSVVSLVDPTATNNPSTNYPAFNYANSYGTKYNLPSEYRDGWYLPSCSELHELALNRNIINEVIEKIPSNYTPQRLFGNQYWSSSQAFMGYPSTDSTNYNNFACCVDLFDGMMDCDFKDEEHYVCSIRAF